MTPFIKKKNIKNNWYLVNATDIVVGRLAAYISKVLRGKNKAMYNPNQIMEISLLLQILIKLSLRKKNLKIKNIINILVILVE